MTFADWCAEPLVDGHHRFDALPLPALHPLLHGQFVVELDIRDGVIVSCTFDASGSHRGDEQVLQKRDYKQGLAFVNRHSWLTAAFAETLYARIIEDALGIAVSERTAALRELVLELNAAAALAYWDAVDAEVRGDRGDLTPRERVLDVLERVVGARIHPTYVRIGGVSADIDAHDVDAIRSLGMQDIDRALAAVIRSEGPISVSLPKVIRLPQGEYTGSIKTPHGPLNISVHSSGDKVPAKVELHTAGSNALEALAHDAVGMRTPDFFLHLASTRLVLGEVAR